MDHNKHLFLYLSLIITLLLSVGFRFKNQENKPKTRFFFPEIIDEKAEEETFPVLQLNRSLSEHYLYYIGTIKDPITVDRNIRPTFQKVLGEDSLFTYKPTGLYNKYFVRSRPGDPYKYARKGTIEIKMDRRQSINNYGKRAFPVIVQNTSNDTLFIGAAHNLFMIVEAKDERGKWKAIEKRHSYCGVGLQSIILPPNEIALTSTLVYSGKFKTKLRIKIGDNYSQEFLALINKSQMR